MFCWYSSLSQTKPELTGGNLSCRDQHWLEVHAVAQCCYAVQYRQFKECVMFPGFPSYKHSGLGIIQQFDCGADRIYSLAACVTTIVIAGRLQCSNLTVWTVWNWATGYTRGSTNLCNVPKRCPQLPVAGLVTCNTFHSQYPQTFK